MPRLLIRLLALVLLATGVRAQVELKARPVSKEIATQVIKEFSKTYSSKDDKIRLAAVDRLTTLKHRLIAKALARVLRKDRSQMVRAEAARRLGLQDPKHAMRPLLSAFQNRSNKKKDEVLIGVLDAWVRMGKAPPLKVLTKSWAQRSKEIQQAVVKAAVLRRDTSTVKWLAPFLDAPRPANVDSPSNPPASYWKRKLERWTFWIDDVHDALADLTDQDFESTSEVRQWLKRGGKVLTRRKKKS